MKKIFTHFTVFLLMTLFAGQAISQTDCHALFSFHQTTNNLTVDFTDLSTSHNTITSWQWDFGNGNTSNSQNPSHTYAHDGTYTVCLNIHDDHGCSHHSCLHVTVNPVSASCHGSFSFHQISNTLTVNFTDLSTSTNNITSWSWDFGDGNTSSLQNPDHTYNHEGTYNVCLTIHDDHGCSNTYCHHFTLIPVTPDCHVGFTFQQVANTLSINFTDASTSSSNITSWLWEFGDGSTSDSQNPSYTYPHYGTFTVCLTIHDDNGCSHKSCQHITVNHGAPPCHASFTFTVDSTDVFHFINNSTGTTPNTTYYWDFGDGNSSADENPDHTYAHTGHYTVCLFIKDETTGCSSHFCHSVNYHHNNHHFHSLDEYTTLQTLSISDLSTKDKQYIINFPNPANSSTTIQYELVHDASVTIEIYDFMGNKKELIINQNQTKGLHDQLINTYNLNSGFYLINMIVDGEIFKHRIAVLK